MGEREWPYTTIRVEVSFVQHKRLEIMYIPEVFIFEQFDANVSSRGFELV